MTIEVTAKKVEDAIKQGLEQLGASLDEVQVEVIESGGLFRKAKVRLTLEREEQEEHKKAQKDSEPAPAPEAKKPEQKSEQPKQKPVSNEGARKEKPEQVEQKSEQKPRAPKQKEDNKKTEPKKPDENKNAQDAPRPAKNSEDAKQAIARATEFISTLVQKMGFDGATVEANENGDVSITAPAGDDSLIIGRHGETLSAISFLAETLGRAEKQHVNIVADCNGYRERRAASLTAMAQRRANEAVAKHRKIKLEPMERVDRRTIHNALTDDNRVTTSSEGKEPHRYIVIIPKKQD